MLLATIATATFALNIPSTPPAASFSGTLPYRFVNPLRIPFDIEGERTELIVQPDDCPSEVAASFLAAHG